MPKPALIEAMTELDEKYYEHTIARIETIAQNVKNILNQDQLAVLTVPIQPTERMFTAALCGSTVRVAAAPLTGKTLHHKVGT